MVLVGNVIFGWRTADLLGLHVNTAVRWVIYARRDWTDYLAARTMGAASQSGTNSSRSAA
jgi:hypothetical protein